MGKAFTEYQKEMAFDRYYAMGAKRELKRLAGGLAEAEEFKDGSPAWKTLKKWSAANNWQERCKQRDIENSSKQHEKTDREVVKTKAAYRIEIGETREQLELFRTRFEKLIADATEAIEKGRIKINDVNELDRVASSLKKLHDLNKDYIHLDLKLVGEDVPDRTDLNIILKLPEDLEIDSII